MGCHTWVAKKIAALTQEEKQQRITDSLREYQTMYLYKSAKEYRKTMLPFYKEEVEEYDEAVKAGKYKDLSEKEQTKIKKLTDGWRKFVEDHSLLDKEYEKHIKEKAAAIALLEKGGEEAFQFAIKKEKYPEVFSHKGEKYMHISFDHPFRVSSGYSLKKITSEDELLEYLKDGGELVGFYDDETNKFISGYSDALVERIHAYFVEHGKDNLLFHFG